jgi:gliding motility-associated-like protein
LTCELTEQQLNGTGSSVGSEFQYEWTGPGTILNENTLSPTIQEPGTYQLLVTNLLNNCQSTTSVTVGEDVTPPTAEAGNGGVLSCSMTNMLLDGSGSSAGVNYIYEWDSPNGSIFSNGTTLTPTINAPGNYILTVTNTVNGCTSSDMVTIDQDASLPTAVVQPAQPLTCNVTELSLTANGTVTGSDYTYLWSTANGSILSGDTTLNPLINAPGIYLLTVTNTATNCTNIASVTVGSQTTPPVAEAGPSVQLTCTQNSLTLSGNGSAAGPNYAYLWTTVDGSIIGDNTILNPTVDEPGTYVIQVTNLQTGCTNTDQVIVSESLNAPVAVAITPGVLTCTNTNLLLSGVGSSTGSTFSYQWTTQDGNIQLGATSLSPQINEPGTYLLTVTNSLNGCTETASIQVEEDVTAPTAEAGTANLLTCDSPIQNLNGNGSSTGNGFSYLWSTANGNIVNGGTTLNPSINQVGTYTLTVTNLQNGCTSADNVVVGQDNSLPQAAIAPPALLTCVVQDQALNATASQGANFSYLWTTNGGNILGGETTLAPQVNQPGVYVLTVTNTDNGCSASTQATVTQDVQLPTADAGQPFIMDCFEEYNSLDGSGSNGSGLLAYLWSTTDGTIVAGINTMNASISNPGTYVLTVTNTVNGCTDTDQVLVTREGPVTEPLATQPPCYGDKGTITLSGATGGVTPYLYSVDNGANFSSSAVFTNLEPGLYNAIVQDANGCEFDKEVSIIQPDQFDVFVEPQVTMQLGDSYQLNTQVSVPITEIQQVDWFPIFNLSCSDCLDPIATPPTSTTYTVTVVTKNGCKDSAPVFFRVDKTGGVYVPNAFSPNGDGTNDVFMIFSDSKSVVKVKSFLVFNRWGETVYQYFDFNPNDPAYGWDGKHRGQAMDPAVFTWFAEVEFIDGRIELFKGDVTLMN